MSCILLGLTCLIVYNGNQLTAFNARADWLLKLLISFAIHLRAIRAEFEPGNVVIFARINKLK